MDSITVAGMRWRAAAGGMAPALSAGWNISNVGAVADELSSSYGVSLAVIGLFETALFVTHAALQVPAGRLCDRLGARLVGVVGLVVTAAASFLALTWHEAAFAISMRTLAGVGTGPSFVAGSDYVRSTIGTPVAQGVYGASSMAGGGLALALVPLFASWRAPFASAAFIAGGSACPRRGAASGRADRRRRRPSTSADRRLLRLAVMHSASFGFSVVIGNWVVTLLERAGGYSAAVAGVAGALTLLLGIVTRPSAAASSAARGSSPPASSPAEPRGAARRRPAARSRDPGGGRCRPRRGHPLRARVQRRSAVRPDAPAAAVGLVNWVRP
jgi:MFS family permease